MNVSVLQEDLAKATSAVVRIIPTNPQVPILSHMLLRATKSGVSISGTDLVTSINLSVGGKIEEEGSVAVPGRDFAAFVAALPSGRVKMTSEKGKLHLRSEGMKATFIASDPGDYPEIIEPSSKGVSFTASEFLTRTRQVLFSIGQDEGRPILSGVKISEGGNALQLLATDGYRLSRAVLREKGAGFQGGVVPGKTLAEATRLVKGERVTISGNDEGIAVVFEGGWVTGRLLAGDYPPAERIIPEEVDLSVTCDRNGFERAVRTAAIFARGSANIVKLTLSGNVVVVSANSPEIGENEARVECERSGDKKDGEIAFNSRYLLDWLGSVESERMVFGMVGPLKPGVFRPEGDDDYTHVIMPVRLQKTEREK